MALTIQWDTQHDSPNQSTFCSVPYTRLTRRAYLTTPAAVRRRFLPLWRCLLVALRKVRGSRVCARALVCVRAARPRRHALCCAPPRVRALPGAPTP